MIKRLYLYAKHQFICIHWTNLLLAKWEKKCMLHSIDFFFWCMPPTSVALPPALPPQSASPPGNQRTGSGRTTAFSTTFKMGYAVSEWMNYCLSGWLTDWVTEWQGRDALGPFPIPSKNATLWANEWMNDRKENRILIWTSKKSPGSESDPRKTPCSFFMKIGNFNCTFWQLILITLL